MKTNIMRTLVLLCFFSISINAHSQDALLNSIIKTVSPIETADLIKKLNIPYNKSLLNSPNNTYSSDFKNALNLGVYSSDLGYANINEQSADALSFLTAVKGTADKINVGNFIDVGKILGIAANKDNLNMLLEVTTETFEKMSDYLQKQDRSDLAAMVLVGGYIESFYIMCRVANEHPNNTELSARVIEQKLVLEQILQVLNSPQFSNNQNILGLLYDLNNLNAVMGKYQFVSSGEVVTTQKTIGDIEVVSISDKDLAPEMTISRSDLQSITDVVSEIRRAITQ